tara:strand:+ start:660 stop:869 length:210 start_codon:yes stop_codon:yes gene_type:complete
MSYNIIKFYREGKPSEIVKRGLSLDEAKEYCNRPDTAGDGWFCGFQWYHPDNPHDDEPVDLYPLEGDER